LNSKGGDSEVFVAAIFEHGRGDRKQMRDVGRAGTLAHLAAVDVRRVQERAIEPVSENSRLAHVIRVRLLRWV
jgi:hypothetical protein